MLRLIIMRHAKSSWASPGKKDFDRELNERGREDLIKVSAKIHELGIRPELVLCSSATRTRETLSRIIDAFDPNPKIEYIDALYSGGMDDYLSVIGAVKDASSVMIVGHNPMSGTLANKLSNSGDEAALNLIAMKYPTSAFSIIEFNISDWSKISNGHGNLIDCIIPSKL
ncbi:MAG: histidine phosphatase family protein [Pseudomonadota bacterium]